MKVRAWRAQVVLPIKLVSYQGDVLSMDHWRRHVSLKVFWRATANLATHNHLTAHCKKFNCYGVLDLIEAASLTSACQLSVRPKQVVCFPTPDAALMWLLTSKLKHSN